MKKVTLVCLEGDKDATLHSLRDMGVLHMVPVKEPEGPDVSHARAGLQRSRQAVDLVKAVAKGKAIPVAGPNDAEHSVETLIEEVHRLAARKKELGDRIVSLEIERSVVEPWGEFDPDQVRSLNAGGITVRLYHSAVAKLPDPPHGVERVILRSDKSGTRFMLAGIGEFSYPGREVPLPERPLSKVMAELEDARIDLSGTQSRLFELAGSISRISETSDDLAFQSKYVETRAGMGSAEQLAYLQGFCPEDAVEDIRSAALEEGWGLMVEEPASSDKVPTLIRNPAWLRPIESLFDVIKILPGYNEVDVSAAFFVFMSIFFAMIIGDAGYGLIFLLLLVTLRRKMTRRGPEMFRLMMVFTVCTLVWGVLSGTYFGIGVIPGPLERLKIQWLGNEQNMMGLCLLIGSIHLTVAHGWNVVRMINSTQAIAQAGWIGVTWTIYFLARTMLIGSAFPGFAGIVGAVSLVAVVVFMTPVRKLKADWVNHVMLPLTLMSNFGDVLSYLRLFALSVASFQLAGAFNSMTASFAFGGVLQGMAGALVLFFGHALNIALGGISVLVHAIRLNALEFSTHFGLEWSGSPYMPFVGRKSNKAEC